MKEESGYEGLKGMNGEPKRGAPEGKKGPEAMIRQDVVLEILKALPGTLNAVDKDYNILMVGGEIARTFQEIDHVIGKKCYSVFQNAESPCPWCKIDKVLQEGAIINEITTPDDPREALVKAPLHVCIRPLKDRDGNIIGALELGTDITEIREANEKYQRLQDKLKKSVERYRRMFENIQDVYYEVTMDGTILELSPSIEDVLQYKREELIGKSTYDTYADPRERDELVNALRKSGTLRDYEIVLKNRDGSQVSCSVSVQLVTDDEDHSEKIVGSLRNVTHRKRVEGELADIGVKQAAIMASFPGVLDVVDRELTVLWANETARQFAQGDPLGEKCYRVYRGRDKPCEDCQVLETFKTGKPAQREQKIRLADGTTEYFDIKTSVVKSDKDGNPTQVLECATNITERKRAEKALQKAHEELERQVESRTAELVKANKKLKDEIEEGQRRDAALRESTHRLQLVYEQSLAYAQELRQGIVDRERVEKALRESEGRLQLILQTIPTGLFMVDLDRKITYWNKEAEKITGLQAEDAVGKQCLEAFDCADCRQGCPLFDAEAGEPLQEESTIYVGGKKILISRYGHLLKNVSGRAVGGVQTFIEITERKRAEQALVTSHDKLQSLASELSLAEERERRRVASEVHDCCSQNLAFVKLRLGALRASTASSDLAAALEEILELVDESIENTRSLISELGSPILYELGFVPAVEWLCQQTQKRHGIVVDFEDDGQAKPLSDDVRVLLFQAVREVLVNIVKHAETQIAGVSIARVDDQVRVEVQDDGVGFDSTEIGPSLDTTGRFGLFSIRMRLEPLGGQMVVESTPDRGTQVSLRAPLEHVGGKEGRVP